MTRILAVLVLLVLVGARAVDVHEHGCTPHADSCLACRAMQAPIEPPTRALEATESIEVEARRPCHEQDAPAPESPVLASHRLRAPPSA